MRFNGVCVFLAIDGRGYAKIFPKLLCEEGLIVIPRLIRDLDDWQVGILQKLGRVIHALRGDIGNERSARVFLKTQQEMRVRVVAKLYKVFNLFGEVFRFLYLTHKVGKPIGWRARILQFGLFKINSQKVDDYGM